MNILELTLLSLIISIDSFILCLLTQVNKKRYYLLIPFVFALFQTLFFSIGYFISNAFESALHNYLKYIIFLVYSFMSLKMLINTIMNKEKEEIAFTSFTSIIIQSIISSIDSLFLGMPLAFSSSNFFTLIIAISSSTYILCFLALLLRSKFNHKYDDLINLIGSIILILFAFKSLF